MADMVNQRFFAAQEELKKRAARLERIVQKAKGKPKNEGIAQGIKLVGEMISGQSQLLDTMVFETPKTALEQQRNLALATGNANQTVQEGMRSTTDAIDGMLEMIEQMLNQKQK